VSEKKYPRKIVTNEGSYWLIPRANANIEIKFYFGKGNQSTAGSFYREDELDAMIKSGAVTEVFDHHEAEPIDASFKVYPRTIRHTNSGSRWIIPHPGATESEVKYRLIQNNQNEPKSMMDEAALDRALVTHPKLFREEARPAIASECPIPIGALVLKKGPNSLQFRVSTSWASVWHDRVRWVVSDGEFLAFADEVEEVQENFDVTAFVGGQDLGSLQGAVDRAIDDALYNEASPERQAAAASLIQKKQDAAFAQVINENVMKGSQTMKLDEFDPEEYNVGTLREQRDTARRACEEYVETIEGYRREAKHHEERIVKLEADLARMTKSHNEIDEEATRLHQFEMAMLAATQIRSETKMFAAFAKAEDALRAARKGTGYDMNQSKEPLSEEEVARRIPPANGCRVLKLPPSPRVTT
jgi:flagellar hook-associated protein FlgK